MTVEGGSFLLPIRHTRRNRSLHLGQVATAKAMINWLFQLTDRHRCRHQLPNHCFSSVASTVAVPPLLTVKVLSQGLKPGFSSLILWSPVESRNVEDSPKLAEEWKAAMGWDPREMEGWVFYRLRPTRIQAFRGYDEIGGRDVMLRSRWVI